MKNFDSIIIADPDSLTQTIARAILEECVTFDSIYKCSTNAKVLSSIKTCLSNDNRLPSLVLLNSYLSEKETLTLFKKIINHPDYSSSVTQLVVMVNSHIDKHQRDSYQKNGIKILEKPLTLEKMKRVLNLELQSQ